MKKAHIVILVIIVLSLSVFYYAKMQKSGVAQRQQAIHERGMMVMPFDLNKTMHSFERTASGGIQQVRAKDAKDEEQISLIRSHLKSEARLFSTGNFRDPMALHGSDMPGLDVLSDSSAKFNVEYGELQDGAQLIFTSEDSEVIEAFKDWFAAQLMDHGTDAVAR